MAVQFEISEDMLAAAEAAASDFANMGEAYAEEAEAEAGKILDLCRTAQDADSHTQLQEALSGIFSISHNLKGQGDTFGYQLATRIAQHLCELTRPVNKPTASDVPQTMQLATALHSVLQQRLEGDGGAMGKQLCTHLGI